jgi:hypothetical protein
VADSSPKPTTALPLVSYKLRLLDAHVRAVPACTNDGAPFDEPGVDLRGADAAEAIAAARPLISWLDAREPGVEVRSISVKTAGPRVLVSVGANAADARPRAIRIDPPYAEELRAAGLEAERVIGEACSRALSRRRAW